ncbi:MAG: pyridoxal-phosphate dependent enzyme, partial [bacterium]
SVTDAEIMDAVSELASSEGLFVCPEGAATWAAVKQLRARGELDPGEKIVLFNTGSGLKYPEIFDV